MSDRAAAPDELDGRLSESMDIAWRGFRRLVAQLPTERLNDRLGDGAWTRKQMLAHICAWHDLTTERLTEFMSTNEKVPLAEDDDVINARVARAAAGRTAGEIISWLDDSFARVRRIADRLSGEQLAAHEGWAEAVIAGNTYGHYAEHRRDLESSPRVPVQA
ncbi:hypothetical protein BH24CHL7_BH24CHL7_07880 [soil metagenome]